MAYEFNPLTVGGDVGRYYNAALSGDPRMPGINRNLQGVVAPDVKRQLAQAAAERGIGIGSYGGGNDASSFLRALGLTSMDLTNKGLGQYGDVYGQVPKLNTSDLFINPTNRAEMDLRSAMQKTGIEADAARQFERLASAERMQAVGLGNEAYEFGINRADTLSGVAAQNALLDKILARSSGGGVSGINSSLKNGGAGGGQASDYYPATGWADDWNDFGQNAWETFPANEPGAGTIDYTGQPTEYYPPTGYADDWWTG